MTVLLADSAPADSCTVDLTPRRLQRFKTPPDARFRYRVLRPDQSLAAPGEAAADASHLLTLVQIPLAKGANRVVIEAVP
jgi:hypothetical protein